MTKKRKHSIRRSKTELTGSVEEIPDTVEGAAVSFAIAVSLKTHADTEVGFPSDKKQKTNGMSYYVRLLLFLIYCNKMKMIGCANDPRWCMLL